MLQRMVDAYHVMIDIETLGTEPGCFIWQVGAAGASGRELLTLDLINEDFSTHYYETAKIPVNIETADPSLVNSSTLNWQWTKNANNFSKALEQSYQAPTEHDMLWDFLIAMRDVREFTLANPNYKEIFWWSKSVRFDFPILEAALVRNSLISERSSGKAQYPWRYWELQEHRTALLLAGRTGKEGRDTFNAHNAIEDAHKQLKDLALCVQAMAREIGWNG